MDVFQVVKALRVQKPGAVHTVESTIATPFAVTHSVQCKLLFSQTEFHTVFEAVMVYLDSFSTYDNFQDL